LADPSVSINTVWELFNKQVNRLTKLAFQQVLVDPPLVRSSVLSVTVPLPTKSKVPCPNCRVGLPGELTPSFSEET
jgi:hypothetical protein